MRREALLGIGVLVLVAFVGSARPAWAEVAPTIQSVQPLEAASGAEVTIAGTGFGTDRRAARVTLGGMAVPIRAMTPTEIRFLVPPGATSGSLIVSIGGREVHAPQPFTVSAALQIISFAPAQGSANTEVTIMGSGFALPPSENRVTLTGIDCPVISGSATELRIRIPDGAIRTGMLEVVTRRGARALSGTAFTVLNAPPPPPSVIGQGRPVIDRFEPLAGPPGTVVALLGRNFDSSVEVWFGGQRLPVIELQPTRLSVAIPAVARSGRFTLRGRFTVESRQPFTVQEVTNPPSIASFSPVEGPPGTQVTILGDRFGAQSFQNRVTIGGRPCIVRSASSQRLVVEVPTGATSGPFTVAVTGAGEAASAASFTVFAELTIAGFAPTNGAVGTRITMQGAGFVPAPTSPRTPNGNQVTINGAPARVISSTETEIVFEVAQGTTSGPVEVLARGVRRRARDPFRITTPPVVQRFAPSSGAPGAEVTIYGLNFGSTTTGFTVRLGTQALRVLAVGPTQARVQIVDGAVTGPFEVEVHSQGVAQSSTPFTVYAPITIREFTPTLGPIGTEITIRGTGYSPVLANNTVLIGGRPARVLAAGETELRAVVPERVSGGRIRVQVRGREAVESASEFVVTTAPVVARFTPASGAPGTQVALQGDHFGTSMDTVTVTLGGATCPLASVGPTLIALRIPDNASSGRFQVTVRNQGSGESSTDFEVLSPLTISSFAPTGGPGGTEVVISGAGFAARTRDNEVFLGPVAVQVLSARGDELRVRLPANATTGRFRVRAAGRGEALSRNSFRVQVGLAIDRIEPPRGQVGDTVRLLGQGFSLPELRVLLNGQPVQHTVVSDGELTVGIPTGAASGPFIVRVARMGEARSAGVFTVTVPPVLTAMSPNSGPPGTVVTLQGQGFNPLITANRARINDVQLMVEAVSPTQMRVRIPPNAQSGPITVEVQDRGHASTTQAFRFVPGATPAPPPPSVVPPTNAPPPPPTVVVTPAPTPVPTPAVSIAIQGFSPRSGPPGTLVQILGDGWGTNPAEIQVMIGETRANVVSVEGRMLTVRVPDTAQTGPIRILRQGPTGGSSAQTPVPFTVQR
jgi:hypothetical protein